MKGFILFLSIISQYHCQISKDKRVYRFAFSNDGPPANYVNRYGKLVGQSVDMILEVCKFANRTCKVHVVQRRQCWDAVSGYPPFSLVLNNQWYDACANLPKSTLRELNYIFPKQTFYLTAKFVLLTSEKSPITANSLSTCNNYSLAYPANTALDPDCLLNLGYFVQRSSYVPVYVEGDLRTIMSTIIEMVKNGSADMGLAITRFQGNTINGVRTVLTDLDCAFTIGGGLNNMMNSKDIDFVEWWNDALHRFLCSGKQYTDFCKLMEETYNADPLCRKPGVDVDCSKFGGLSIKERPQKKEENPEEPAEVLNPCEIAECKKQQISTSRNNFFSVHDNHGLKTTKALVGAREKYKAPPYKMVGITLEAAKHQFFRVDKFCVTVGNVKFIKFIFRGGEKIADEAKIPVDIKDLWTTQCVLNKGHRDKVRVELEPLKSGQGHKDGQIRVKDLELTVCVD